MTGNYGQMHGDHSEVPWHVGPDFSIPYGSAEHGQSSMYEHPALFGQDQFRDNMGPVYAVPSFPWQQGGGHGAGGGQWPPYGHYPQMPMQMPMQMPGCMRCGYSPWMGQGIMY